MPSFLRPMVLLGILLLPLAARAGAVIDLLDAGRAPHPASLFELLVHGHVHGGKLPAHDHAARVAPGTPEAAGPPAALGASVAPGTGSRGTGHEVAGPAAAERALSTAPPRHLLLASLRR